jgi:hypothetical protein
MASEYLPPELAELEQELTARGREAPAPALRGRVLSAVRRESRRRERRAAWRFAAATAAAALLLANLAVSAARNTDWRLAGGLDGDHLAATAGRLRAVVPELSAGEAHRQALVAQARSRLAPAPAPPTSPSRFLRFQELRAWDTH